MTALTNLQTALATAGLDPVDIVCIGDSVTESMVCAHREQAYPQRLRDLLRAKAFSGRIYGGLGYAPSYSVSSSVGDFWGRSAGVIVDATLLTGLGQRMLKVPTGESVTLGFTGTGLDVLYTSGTNSAFSYSVDGGVGILLDKRQSALESGKVEQIRGLCDGAHTIFVTGATIGGTSYNAYVEGALVYRGDETWNVRMFEAGHSGARASDLNANANWHGSLQAIPALKLATIAFGRNEYQLQVPPATFQAELSTLATTVKSLIPATCSLVLLAEHQRVPIAGYADQNLYTAAVAAVAASVGAGYLDLSVAIGPPLDAIAAGLIESGTGCHPTQTGHSAYATAINAYLTTP